VEGAHRIVHDHSPVEFRSCFQHLKERINKIVAEVVWEFCTS
jgi:hypothetical protein